MTAHRVYYGRGAQTLYTIPHLNGRPVVVASATYGIFDLRYADSSTDHDLVAAGTAATVDSVSTTTTAKAGNAAADRRIITVSSTTGVSEGHTYWLEASDGKGEPVKIADVKSATALLTYTEIVGNYATGSTFEGLEVQATFPESAANDEDNLSRDETAWLIKWIFAGLSAPRWETIHLERAEVEQLATLADVHQIDPMLARVGGDRIDPAVALSQAHVDLRTDLLKANAPEARVHTGTLGQQAVAHKAAFHILKHATGESDVKRAEYYERRYQEILAALLVGKPKPEVVEVDLHDEAKRYPQVALFQAF